MMHLLCEGQKMRCRCDQDAMWRTDTDGSTREMGFRPYTDYRSAYWKGVDFVGRFYGFG